MSQAHNVAEIRQMMAKATTHYNEYTAGANDTIQSLNNLEASEMSGHSDRVLRDTAEINVYQLKTLLRHQSVRLDYFAQEIGILQERLQS